MNKYAIRLFISTILFGKCYHNISVLADSEEQARWKVKEMNPIAVIEICTLIKEESLSELPVIDEHHTFPE